MRVRPQEHDQREPPPFRGSVPELIRPYRGEQECEDVRTCQPVQVGCERSKECRQQGDQTKNATILHFAKRERKRQCDEERNKKNHPAQAGQFVDSAKDQLRQPFVRRQWLAVHGVRKNIRGGDRALVQNRLADRDVPAQVAIHIHHARAHKHRCQKDSDE